MDQNSQDKPIANSDNNSITELNVEVLSPEKVIYKGPAVAISAVNNKGKFDVLFQHAQFISIINGDLIIHFNARYLIEPLNYINSDKINLLFNGNNKPLMVKGEGDESFRYLIMPVNR